MAISRNRFFQHALFWLLMLTFNVSRYHMTFDGYDFNQFLYDLKEVAILQPIIMIAAYFTSYFLIEKYLLLKKYVQFTIYFFISILVFVLTFRLIYFFIVIQFLVPDQLKEGAQFFNFNFVQHAFYIYNSVAFFVLVKFIKQMYQNQEIKARLEQQNIQSELAMLRSQVNPHFLFNTLNNINSLANIDIDKLTGSIVKLSDIMRYMLYKTDDERVPLENEINYITSYIDLQQLRLKEESFTKFEITGNPTGVFIAPLLLILPVENAFKHCKKDVQSPGIIINLKIDQSELNFSILNFKKPQHVQINASEGLGLKNLERRLQLLYPKKHTLHIFEDYDRYKLEILIQLK